MKSKNVRKSLVVFIMSVNILISAGVVLVLLFGVIPKVSAATGCFPDSNGHWAETFICWLEENDITGGYPDGTYQPERAVTRAEMAVFLQKTYEKAAPITGEIWLNSAPINWRSWTSDDDLSWEYYSAQTKVKKASTGQNYVQLSPDVPSLLFGHHVKLIGVNFCYEASSNAYLDKLIIRRTSGVYTFENLFEDPTDRSDETCRRYNLSSPVTLGESESLVLFLDLEWAAADNEFNLGTTSFIFEATDVEYP